MLNRQVPEVRILLLPLIRLVSSVGLEHDATNVGVGSSNLSRVTEIYLDIVFNGSIRSLGDCGVSSSLAIQTKKASFHAELLEKKPSLYVVQ